MSGWPWRHGIDYASSCDGWIEVVKLEKRLQIVIIGKKLNSIICFLGNATELMRIDALNELLYCCRSRATEDALGIDG